MTSPSTAYDEGPDLTRVITGYPITIAAAATLFCLLVYVLSSMLPDLWQARTEMLIQQSATTGAFAEANDDTAATDRFLANQVQLMESTDVLHRVVEGGSDRVADMSVESLREQIRVNTREGTDTIVVTVRHGDRDTAVELAERTVQAYQEAAREDSENRLAGRLEDLAADREQVMAELIEMDAASGGDELTAVAEVHRDLLLGRLTAIETESQSITSRQEAGGARVRVTTPPTEAVSLVRPQPLRYAVLGFIVGAMLAVAVLWFRLDQLGPRERLRILNAWPWRQEESRSPRDDAAQPADYGNSPDEERERSERFSGRLR